MAGRKQRCVQAVLRLLPPDPIDLAFDALVALGADVTEANAICAMIDLFGEVDDLAGALEEYRRMAAETETPTLAASPAR